MARIASFKPALLAFSIAASVSIAGCATTTSPTGRTQYVGAVSQQQLDQLGLEAFNEVRSKKPLSNDARQNAYVRCVVDSVTRELPPQWQQYRWDAALFTDASPNAFALPGGKVGVYTGIFNVARNQDQLAAVIAHEVGHVVSRHHDERITRQYGAQFLLQIASQVAGARYGQGVGSLVGQLGSAGLMGLFVLPGTRAQESEADIVGQQLMARAGFDPRAAVGLWENMISVGSNRAPQWMSTHPDPESRLGELRDGAGALMPIYEQARASGRKPNCG